MTRSISFLIALAIVGSLLGAGCLSAGTAPEPAGDSSRITVTDLTGRTVEVAAGPDRILGIGAGALRMIVYLGAEDLVVGMDEREFPRTNDTAPGMPAGRDRPYNLAHPDLASLPYAGSARGGDPELIAMLDPDVVFLTFTTAKDAQALQDRTGIPVVALVTGDLGKNRESCFTSLRTMATVLGREQRADKVIGYINATMADLDRRTADIPEAQKKRVYVGGIAYNGAHGFLSTEPGYAPLAMVNGRNLAADIGMQGQVMIDREKLLEWDPDIVLIDEASYALVSEDLKDPIYQSLSAVRNGRVYGVMPYNWYANNYDTVLADAYSIGSLLYPDRFADIDPEVKADEIYTALDGEPVYGQMKAIFGGFVPFHEISQGG